MKRNMIRGLIAAVILTTSMIAHPHSAASQMMRSCAGRSEVVNFLDKNFAERLTAVGLINQNAMLEVYAAQSGHVDAVHHGCSRRKLHPAVG